MRKGEDLSNPLELEGYQEGAYGSSSVSGRLIKAFETQDAAFSEDGYIQFIVPRGPFAESEIVVGPTLIVEGFSNATYIWLDEVVNEVNRQVVGLNVRRSEGESGSCSCPITILGYEYYIEYTLTLHG